MKTPVSFWLLDCQKLTGVEMISDVVGLTRFNLNAQLARYLRECPSAHEPAPPPNPSLPSYHAPPWRVRDRLSDQDIAQLIAAFKAGTPKHELAKRYGIALRTLKQLLRAHGVKRKSRWDIQP